MRAFVDLSDLVLVVLDRTLVGHLPLILIEVGREGPNLLSLHRVINQPVIVFQVQFVSQLDVPAAIDQLNDDHLRRVDYVKHDRLVPNRCVTNPLVRLGDRVVLGDLHQVGTLSQVLCVDDVHFKLGVVANVGVRIHVLVFVSLGLLELHHHFVLLARVVDHFTHDFLLPLDKLLAGVDVRFDEFISRQIKQENL